MPRIYAGPVLALLAAAGLARPASCQDPGPQCTLTSMHSYTNSSPPLSRAGVPFSATIKVSFDQTLADGNTLHGETHVRQARNSAGKIFHESPAFCRRNSQGKPFLERIVSVVDLTGNVAMSWNVVPPAPSNAVRPVPSEGIPASRFVTVSHPRVLQSRPPSPPSARETPAPPKPAVLQSPSQAYRVEDLGTRTVAGVTTHGIRTIVTIAAGEVGNAQPLVTVSDNWHSDELGLTLLSSREDPRQGRSTWEVENITLLEPDSGIFEPPPGYEMREAKPPQ